MNLRIFKPRLILSTAVFFWLMAQLDTGLETRLAIINANIITLSSKIPFAQAMVIEGDRIIYVGSTKEARHSCGAQCWILDLNGLTVVPGFIDNHTHMLEGGFYYLQPNLYGKTCQEIVEIIKREVAKSQPDELIFAHSWDYGFCPQPHRKLLDPVSPQNPVLLVQYGGHAVWVNSYFLNKLGITADTQAPSGGEIERDAQGNPTGILKEKSAESAQIKAFLSLNRRQRKKALEKALELFRQAGITSVQDNTWDPRVVWALTELKKEGKLTCRVTCWALGEMWYGPALMKIARYDSKWIRLGPVKLFADGAFSSKTAWMSQPYYGEPDNYGIPRHSPEELKRLVFKFAKNKRQIAVHSIGDRAVNEVLNAIEQAQAHYPWVKNLRFRIEHCQMVLPEDIKRFKELGVLASVQPFALRDPEKDIRILGKERAEEAYPYLSLLKAGAVVSFGSDFPAEIDYNPLLGIYYATTRKSKDGKSGPLKPAECFTPEQALRAYTINSAYAEFTEKEKGTLEPGKLADFVVLSENPLEVPPEKIKDIKVLYTFVGGRQVYPEIY